MEMMKRTCSKCRAVIKLLGLLLSLLIACLNFTDEMIAARALDGAVFVKSSAFAQSKLQVLCEGSTKAFSHSGSIEASSSGDESIESSTLRVYLFDLIEAARVRIYSEERVNLVPRGDAIGISIHTDGVIVVGFGDILLSNGSSVCPAKKSGLRSGDVIKKVNGKDVCTSNELQLALNSRDGAAKLGVERLGRLITIQAEPVTDTNGSKRLGAWVRDSTIGIGTLSFWEERTGSTAALGHAVLDADTQTVLPVLNGRMVFADILGVVKGKSGLPGELKGTFSSKSKQVGTVEKNGIFGVFGKLASYSGDSFLSNAHAIPIAFPDEVHTGEALIYSQLDSGAPKSYSCRIIKAVRQKSPDQKGIVLEITDPELLDAAGGIVQGMSGSPIIQDGRLVGVVTHVFVNDPSMGYGAYAFWVYDAMNNE